MGGARTQFADTRFHDRDDAAADRCRWRSLGRGAEAPQSEASNRSSVGGSVTVEELSMETSSAVIPRAKELYRRELPGAGYVAIDLTSFDDESESEGSRIRVRVERRADVE